MTREFDGPALYPNFHAEKKKQTVRTSSAARKRRDGGGSIPRVGTALAASRSVPVLQRSLDPRPLTAASASDGQRQLAPVTSRRTGPSLMASPNQLDDDDVTLPPPDADDPSVKVEFTVRASRSVAIRGDLGFPTSQGIARTEFPASSGWTAPILQTSDRTTPEMQPASANLQRLVLNARPRTRYARRDGVRQPLERIVNSPVKVEAFPSVEIRRSISSVDIVQHPNAATRDDRVGEGPRVVESWGEAEVASFFLTEVDKVADDKKRLARHLAAGAFLMYGQQQWTPAVSRLSEALTIAEAMDDLPLVGLLNHHIGVALKEQGHAKLALTAQQRALDIALRVKDCRLQGRAIKALGVLFMDAHDYTSALEHQQEALTLAQDERDRELEARVYANLGNLALRQLQFGHALACHERDLKLSLSSALQSASGVARAHRNLSAVYGKLNKHALYDRHAEHATALESDGRAFEIDVELHSSDAVGNIYCQLSSPDVNLVDMVGDGLREAVRSQQSRRSAAEGLSELPIPWTPQTTRQRPKPARSNSLVDVRGLEGDEGSKATPAKRSSVLVRINNYRTDEVAS